MDVPLVIRRRLKELGLDQKDLAVAAEVTESYISQLLASKKAPPAPDRTDIYNKIGKFLKLRAGELSKLANLQRKEALRKKLADPPRPLFRAFRELILLKCVPAKRNKIRGIFEKEPFGELERLITQKLLDVAKRVAKEELESETWLRLVARLGKQSYEEMRVLILEFLDTDVFHVSVENCVSFLEPLIESWDIDLENFGIEIVLNRRLALERVKRFEFQEKMPERAEEAQPGLNEFLKNGALSGDVTQDELDFLKKLEFNGRRPAAIYYYRELQNLRDPLHFVTPTPKPSSSAPHMSALNGHGRERQ
jgi:transcriptional regulator with XRE-family HTH domain